MMLTCFLFCFVLLSFCQHVNRIEEQVLQNLAWKTVSADQQLFRGPPPWQTFKGVEIPKTSLQG